MVIGPKVNPPKKIVIVIYQKLNSLERNNYGHNSKSVSSGKNNYGHGPKMTRCMEDQVRSFVCKQSGVPS